MKGQCQLAADRAAAEHQQAARLLAQVPDGVGGHYGHVFQPRQIRHEGASAGSNDDIARADAATVHFNVPGRGDARLAGDHVNAQTGVALDRIMRLDLFDHALYALHHGGKVDLCVSVAETQLWRFAHLCSQPCRTDQRLGRHAAGVQAVAAHGVLLDQADVRFDCRGDIGADQSAAAGADHHQVAVKLLGLVPALIDAACLDHVQQAPGDQREDAEQDERAEQPRRQNARQRVELTEFAPGIHIHQCAGQHAQLADPPEGTSWQAGQAHRKIDQKEREGGHQTQGKQIECALAVNALIDAFEARAKALLHPILQQKSADQHGQSRPGGGGKGHQQ